MSLAILYRKIPHMLPAKKISEIGPLVSGEEVTFKYFLPYKDMSAILNLNCDHFSYFWYIHIHYINAKYEI